MEAADVPMELIQVALWGLGLNFTVYCLGFYSGRIIGFFSQFIGADKR